HSREAARLLERRPHHFVDEAFGSDPQHLQLELFLRVEVGEETALGEAELPCQGCQAEPVETLPRRQPEGGVENSVARLGSLGHERVVRPVVLKSKCKRTIGRFPGSRSAGISWSCE